MKLKVHNAAELDKNAKATVQSTGRLGFSEGAKKKMKIDAGKFVVIASNEEDETDENLYAWVEDSDINGGFRLNKAGDYYNVNTKPLFDQLQVDYRDKNSSVIYDIVDFHYGDQQIFKLIKRVITRSKRKKKTGDTDN